MSDKVSFYLCVDFFESFAAVFVLEIFLVERLHYVSRFKILTYYYVNCKSEKKRLNAFSTAEVRNCKCQF